MDDEHLAKYTDHTWQLVHQVYVVGLRRMGRTAEEAEAVWAGEPITISLRLRWWRRRMRDRLRWK
jgi:hypothetical protein